MRGKGIFKAPPPLGERLKRIVIQRDHPPFAAPRLGPSHREESLQEVYLPPLQSSEFRDTEAGIQQDHQSGIQGEASALLCRCEHSVNFIQGERFARIFPFAHWAKIRGQKMP